MMRKKLIFFLTIFFGESINAAKKKIEKKAQNDFVGGCTFLVAALEKFFVKVNFCYIIYFIIF